MKPNFSIISLFMICFTLAGCQPEDMGNCQVNDYDEYKAYVTLPLRSLPCASNGYLSTDCKIKARVYFPKEPSYQEFNISNSDELISQEAPDGTVQSSLNPDGITFDYRLNDPLFLISIINGNHSRGRNLPDQIQFQVLIENAHTGVKEYDQISSIPIPEGYNKPNHYFNYSKNYNNTREKSWGCNTIVEHWVNY